MCPTSKLAPFKNKGDMISRVKMPKMIRSEVKESLQCLNIMRVGDKDFAQVNTTRFIPLSGNRFPIYSSGRNRSE
jgi:hypothetical protein